MSNQIFQNLKDLPTPLYRSQCVPHKHEILICGGRHEGACYSYHTLKNEYKLICEYPSHVKLNGHCVVTLIDNNNKDSSQITLLSFGGYKDSRHTLVMKYVSVWSNISNNPNNCNQWIPFTDNHNRPILIGRDYDDYQGVRAVIGGRSNHLLFITYSYNNISVFDLNTFQFIQHSILPTDNNILYHCFVSNLENEQGQEMIKANEGNYQMLLFCDKTGLSIKHEDYSIFQFHQLHVCDDIAPFNSYAYLCINDVILFFGGYGNDLSKSVHKYSIRENKWMTFQNTLPSPLRDCIAILSEEDNHIHIIGGQDDTYSPLSIHMKTKMRIWDTSQLSKNEIKYIVQYWVRILKIKLGWIDDFNKIIRQAFFVKQQLFSICNISFFYNLFFFQKDHKKFNFYCSLQFLLQKLYNVRKRFVHFVLYNVRSKLSYNEIFEYV
ncbi:hypothetical protein RFI_02290 [Reticulomyxa filosa]|uniref:Kelch motif family protein n=1 Tax=Reticulomyxa filosa TaxID=46433 RepID=X6PAY1_RETFI|nr:hypothetical protein RFI_02290 [Reticulomyxa filosa]|eukprot:ETO34797.1 hypothetical protein RFI_02290 [Reticulomyxa filosa]